MRKLRRVLPIHDLTGREFGRLKVLRFVGVSENRQRQWECECSCGKMIVANAGDISKEAGGTKSCGCLIRDRARARKPVAPNRGGSYIIKPRDGSEKNYKTRSAWARAAKLIKGDKCSRCGWNEAECDVHHVLPVCDGGDNTISNSIILCPNCHRVAHNQRIKDRLVSGCTSGPRRLTEDEAMEILTSNLPYIEISKKLDVSITTISSIRKRLTWRHLNIASQQKEGD